MNIYLIVNNKSGYIFIFRNEREDIEIMKLFSSYKLINDEINWYIWLNIYINFFKIYIRNYYFYNLKRKQRLFNNFKLIY